MVLKASVLAISYITLLGLVCGEGPLVTLSHGGKLRGKWITFNGTNTSVFQGIPYVKPPVGELRFKKPQPADAWTGERNATSLGNECPQMSFIANRSQMIGSEDCLYLQVHVPGEINTAAKKPVMFWIHGGGYYLGSANAYIGVPLSVFGDVIVVTINYRLGAFGFLQEGPGTGNFGLWDQRQALVWVKENIASFGGNPEMVTIFGESAGAGSVSALTLSTQVDGLFKRAIMQSGTLFQPWSWYISKKETTELSQKIKEKNNCQSSHNVYDCFIGKTTEQVYVGSDFIAEGYYWMPTADRDFFPENLSDEDYNVTQKYEILAGFNGQEGGVFFAEIDQSAKSVNDSVENGTSLQFIENVMLPHICSTVSPLATGLCQYYIANEYGLMVTNDDVERGRRLVDYYGDVNFAADIMNMLNRHSGGSTKAYGYTFTELFPNPDFWPLPDWVKTSAGHGDELRFVFGFPFLWDTEVIKSYFNGEPVDNSLLANFTTYHDKELSLLMMKMWSNFAKTGDPNTPQSLGVPTWPEYDVNDKKILEINSNDTRVVDIPNIDRLNRLYDTVHSALKASYDFMNEERQSGNQITSTPTSQSTSPTSGVMKWTSNVYYTTVIALLWTIM